MTIPPQVIVFIAELLKMRDGDEEIDQRAVVILPKLMHPEISLSNSNTTSSAIVPIFNA